MPQVFQVLKCFTCSVFQVHQTKKSNKWECKLCNEKQSIKRHYGLGTGKECRLHVQKLNGIRGQLDEANELAELNDSDNEVDTNTAIIKQVNLESKWLEFIDKSDNVQAPESMHLGDAEVVLEVPAKRRKFGKHKVTRNTSVSNTNHNKNKNFGIVQELSERQTSDVHKNLPVMTKVKTNCDRIIDIGNQTESKEPKSQANNLPHRVDENSKWAQFVDEVADVHDYSGSDLTPPSNIENVPDTNDSGDVSNDKNDKNEYSDKKLYEIRKPIFSLCDENDLDDVLDF